jgi:hypothetical protein
MRAGGPLLARARPARAVALLAALAALLASCSSRERANPLDALNPRSGGAPEGFNAIADFVSARVTWTPRPDLDIDGFRLYRKAPFDNDYVQLGSLHPATSSGYFDGGLIDGLDYRYRLFYVVDGANSGRFAEDIVTAGRVRAWTVDAAGGRLIRLAPDGRDIMLARTGFGGSSTLAVTPDHGPLWVSDELGGIVRIRDPQNFTGPNVAGVTNRPFTIALDPDDASAWICDQAGKVVHLTAQGTSAGPSLTNLGHPAGIATDAGTGDVWVTELTGNRVRRYDRAGVPLGARQLPSPSRVAVDSLTGIAWVTSFTTNRVWLVRPDMVAPDSIPASGPVGLALDWRRRTAWIACPGSDLLVGIDMDTRAERFRVAGLGDPTDAAVDLDRGEGWVVAYTAAVAYRFSPAGSALGSVGGLGAPYEIRLDRGYQ